MGGGGGAQVIRIKWSTQCFVFPPVPIASLSLPFPGASPPPSPPLPSPGTLAEKALLAVLPDEEEMIYSVRVTSECMASDGSSSMATVCGGEGCSARAAERMCCGPQQLVVIRLHAYSHICFVRCPHSLTRSLTQSLVSSLAVSCIH